MGGGRDKRKKAKERKEGPLPGKGVEKTERKTVNNEKKKERRALKKLEGDEDDIDALLEKFAIEDKAKKAVTIEMDCPPPIARVNSSFTPYIAPKINEIIMFGGEAVELETEKVRVYNDLYRYNCDKDRWTKVSSPSSPTPRCAHQAVVHKGFMYIFGGEFSSPNQERFHHYKELWRLDLNTWQWDHIPQKGGQCPSPRSGHRMVVHKNRAILFGGFFDSGKEVRYNNELWVLNFEDLKWSVPALPAAGQQWPSPRGGCQMVVYGDTLFLYGGYSKVADEEDREVEHGKVQDDMWALDLNKWTWERVKKAGMAPGPRASFSLVAHKNRALLFGGVSDNETKGGEDLSSDFHNDLFQFNFEKRKWFAAELRPPKQQQQDGDTVMTDAAGASGGASGTDAGGAAGPGPSSSAAAPALSPALKALMEAGRDKNSPIYRAAVRIQSRFRGYVVRKAYTLYKIGGVVSEILYSPAAYGLDMSVKNMPKPRGRISAQVCVVGNRLWLFGGIVEIGEKEITLDDLWTLDVAKMDGWNLVKENTMGEEVFKQMAGQAASSDDDDMDEDDSSSGSGEEE